MMRQLKISKSITSRDGTLESYLQEISRQDLLTADEEVELAQRIHQGDKKAMERLVLCNLRFVVSVAKTYQSQGMSLSDLINEGNIGLIKAAERFDETKGFKFISYAVWWIRQSILSSLAEKSNIVRLPLNQIGSLNKINHMMTQYEQEHGRKPNLEELVQDTGLDEEQITKAMNAQKHHISLDSPMDDESDTRFVEQMVSDTPSTDSKLDKESLRIEIERVLKAILNQKELEIIKLCFGLGTEALSLDEIGLQCNLTRERVRQIKEKGLRKLHESPSCQMLRTFL